jgi:hypothetical protein
LGKVPGSRGVYPGQVPLIRIIFIIRYSGFINQEIGFNIGNEGIISKMG